MLGETQRRGMRVLIIFEFRCNLLKSTVQQKRDLEVRRTAATRIMEFEFAAASSRDHCI